MTSPTKVGPEFRAVGHAETEWWMTATYEQPGTSVPFDAVNGVAVEDVLDTPTYAIDATTADDKTEGLYLVASGCLIDVEKMGNTFADAHVSGKGLGGITMNELLMSGTALPLTKNSPFRLPSQEIGGSVVVIRGKDKITPTDKAASIRRIEADLRPYGVHSREQVIKFATRLGLKGHDITPEYNEADLSGNPPLVRAARRLNYAFAPVDVQTQMRKPLNRTDVIDGIRDFMATKLREHNAAALGSRR